MTVGLSHYLVLAAILFGCGVATLLLRRNALGILMGVELMLNAANVNLVAFNRYSAGGGADHPLLHGQVLAAFIIVLAAAEAAVALAIFLNFYSRFASIDVEQARRLEH